MAHSATATQGFQLKGYVERGEVLLIPGDPGDTLTRGDLVSFNINQTTDADDGIGVLDPFVTDNTWAVGVVAETVTITAATTGFPKYDASSSAAWGDTSSNARNTCAAIIPLVAAGTPIFDVTFAGQTDDENVTAYTASTPSITTTAPATDDDYNGALIYIYGGPGAGCWSIIADSANGTAISTLHRIFETAATTASDVIILSNLTDDIGVSFFSRLDPADANNVTVATGALDGPLCVYMDARDCGRYMQALTLPVIHSEALYFAAAAAAP